MTLRGSGHPVMAKILVPSHSPKCTGKEPVEQVGHTHGADRKASPGLVEDHVTRPIRFCSADVECAGRRGDCPARAVAPASGGSAALHAKAVYDWSEARPTPVPSRGYFKPMQFA